MIKNTSTLKPLVVIPARGGSKGVPNKNIKLLNGTPLIKFTIDAAKGVFNDSVICVSTDSQEIKDVVENLGLNVPFIRPPEFASDTAGTYDVLLHALNYYENSGYFPDSIVLLQPTSPFRNKNHIIEALNNYSSDLDMLVSVKEAKANPYYNLFETNKLGFLEQSKPGVFIRRQDCPKVWEYNGAIYIINKQSLLREKSLSHFKKVKKYEMPEVCSLDIDTKLDWEVAEIVIKNELI